jgi:hypothetical protein
MKITRYYVSNILFTVLTVFRPAKKTLKLFLPNQKQDHQRMLAIKPGKLQIISFLIQAFPQACIAG